MRLWLTGFVCSGPPNSHRLLLTLVSGELSSDPFPWTDPIGGRVPMCLFRLLFDPQRFVPPLPVPGPEVPLSLPPDLWVGVPLPLPHPRDTTGLTPEITLYEVLPRIQGAEGHSGFGSGSDQSGKWRRRGPLPPSSSKRGGVAVVLTGVEGDCSEGEGERPPSTPVS